MAFETILSNVSLAQIVIQDLTNGSLVCVQALNDIHADYLLRFGNTTVFLQMLKEYLGISGLSIDNTYLTDVELVDMPPPSPPPSEPPPYLCSNDCSGPAQDAESDGVCDDGGPGAEWSYCGWGTFSRSIPLHHSPDPHIRSLSEQSLVFQPQAATVPIAARGGYERAPPAPLPSPIIPNVFGSAVGITDS